MPPDPVIDEDYASEEDSDFAPDAAPADGASEASESEADDDQPTAPSKRKRVNPDAGTANEDFENSGDEAIIQKGKKRQKKSKKKDGVPEDDEGGEGGLIKTRSMRATEKAERKSHAVTGPVTIDVDDIWAKMNADPLLPAKQNETNEKENQQPLPDPANEKQKSTEQDPSALIKIKRTYNFAGKVHTEEKLVPRDSAEAKLYLASQDPKVVEEANNEEDEPKRKLRRAFRSAFEPVIENLAQRSDLQLGMDVRMQLREQAKEAKAKKLNVVEKSRMDWAGFVDKEGIKDELELAGKSKESFANRQDFLARVEAKKEEEARRARMAGRA
ncbi:bucentaur or craniofacial development-domain-containing protein [Xylariomycetidae sp. FL0641]|nr:bucentaur or craniofacial development-domain-containing protein [Xylariomycetidae sp. FL0641]